jgi:hypothetical protein
MLLTNRPATNCEAFWDLSWIFEGKLIRPETVQYKAADRPIGGALEIEAILLRLDPVKSDESRCGLRRVPDPGGGKN